MTTLDKLKIVAEAIRIFKPIPKEQWITGMSLFASKSCAMGHHGKAKYNNPRAYIDMVGSDSEKLVRISVECSPNNCPIWAINDGHYEKYNQDNPKDRVMALCYDMLEHYASVLVDELSTQEDIENLASLRQEADVIFTKTN